MGIARAVQIKLLDEVRLMRLNETLMKEQIYASVQAATRI